MSEILFNFSFDSIRNQTDSPSLLKNKFIKITMKDNSGIQNSHDIILENRFTFTDSAKAKKIPSLDLPSINIYSCNKFCSLSETNWLYLWQLNCDIVYFSKCANDNHIRKIISLVNTNYTPMANTNVCCSWEFFSSSFICRELMKEVSSIIWFRMVSKTFSIK